MTNTPLQFKSRYIAPVNPGLPCYLDFRVHVWHVMHRGRFIAAFTNFACAESHAENMIHSQDTDMMNSVQFIQFRDSFRIIHSIHLTEYVRGGPGDWYVKEKVGGGRVC